MLDKKQTLTDAISEALSLGKSDLNEACTCDWIVKPLLQAVGYSLYQIQPQTADPSGKYPDYKILPDTEHTWFVEVKAWGKTLSDSHAQQALIYAFTNNSRWVVLTNGQQWRLYDNSINGLLPEKQVACVDLKDVEAAAEFLMAIGRESMQNGRVEEYAARTQISDILDRELSNPSSEIVRAIWLKLKNRPGLSSLTREQVTRYFNGPIVDPPPPPPPPPSEFTALDELLLRSKELIENKSPSALILPDGKQIEITTWIQLTKTIVTWIIDNYRMPKLPFTNGRVSKRYFLNDQPSHPDKNAFHDFICVSTSKGDVFMEKHRSASDLVFQIHGLCAEIGMSPASISVSIGRKK